MNSTAQVTGLHLRTYQTIFQYPELANRIIGALVVDEHHLSEGQLLAKAREFYASVQRPQV